MSTAPVPAPKVSWIKKVGRAIAKILGIIGKDAAPIADDAAKVAEALLPQFGPEIAAMDALVTKVSQQIIVTEAIGQSVAAAPTGADKLGAVVSGIAPEIDAWVAAAFPGAKQVSEAAKAGLVQAIYNIVDEVDPNLGLVLPSTPAA